MIPGPQDFYDGLNHQLLREMEHLLRPGSSDANHDRAGDLSHTHANWSHEAGLGHSIPDHETSDHADHHRSSWLPSILQDVGHATIKVAAEALFSGVVLGDSHDDHLTKSDLHVGATGGDGFSHQTTAFTCAVVSQKMVMDQFHLADPRTGEPVSEAQLVYDATVNGWLTDHGTNLSNLGKLLEYYGIFTHEGHDWKHLIQDLAQGHQVVIAVNADQLWGDQVPFQELKQLFGHSANHAIVLKGLKVDDHGKVVVVVNDPGQNAGAGVEYSLEHFQAALDKAGMFYVASDDAPPGWAPELAIRQLAGHDAGSDTPTHRHVESSTFAEALSQMTPRQKEDFLRRI